MSPAIATDMDAMLVSLLMNLITGEPGVGSLLHDDDVDESTPTSTPTMDLPLSPSPPLLLVLLCMSKLLSLLVYADDLRWYDDDDDLYPSSR